MERNPNEQVAVLIKIIELIGASNQNISESLPNSRVYERLKKLSEKQDVVKADQLVVDDLFALHQQLTRIERPDPLLVAFRRFFEHVLLGPMREIIAEQESNNETDDFLLTYLEADLSSKLSMLQGILESEHIQTTLPEARDNQSLRELVAQNRSQELQHFMPKTLDLLEILLPRHVCRFNIVDKTKDAYRHIHEDIWRRALAIVDPKLKVAIQRNVVSEQSEHFYIDLLLTINGQQFEWFYSVDEWLDETIFDDLNRTVSPNYPGRFFVENYGQSGYYLLAFVPESVAEQIARVV